MHILGNHISETQQLCPHLQKSVERQYTMAVGMSDNKGQNRKNEEFKMWPLRWCRGSPRPAPCCRPPLLAEMMVRNPLASSWPTWVMVTPSANPGWEHHQAWQHRDVCEGPQNSPWSRYVTPQSPSVAKWVQHAAMPPVR